MGYTPTPGERVLAESLNLLVLHCYEYAYIYFKKAHEKAAIDYFCGDPECALISPDENWVLIGGEHLTLWKKGSITVLKGICQIHSLKLVDETTVDILTDPWADDSAIWRIDIAVSCN